MKTYTIIGGVNGTGKSSLIGVLKALTDTLGPIIDEEQLSVDAGNFPPAGGEIAAKHLKSCMEHGVSFAQESNLYSRLAIETAKEAAERGYYVRLYYIGLDSAEECIRRVANRAERGGHTVDPELVSRCFETRWGSLADVLPYCNETIFFDNTNGFARVAFYRSGDLLTVHKNLPGWLSELTDFMEEHEPFL